MLFGRKCDIISCPTKGEAVINGQAHFYLCARHKKEWIGSKEAAAIQLAFVRWLEKAETQDSRKIVGEMDIARKT